MKSLDLVFIFLSIAAIAGGGFLIMASEQTEIPMFSPIEENIEISVHAFILKDSQRDQESVQRLIDGANRIWEQGNVSFVLSDVTLLTEETNIIRDYSRGQVPQLSRSEADIDMYLDRHLAANGVAYPQHKMIFVSDITSVNDWRTTAHEFGHILGLKHVSGRENLMYRGSNGEILREWEIESSRKVAESL